MTEQNVEEETKAEVPQPQRGKFGIFFSIILIVILLCAFGYGYFQLYQANISLSRMVDDLQSNYTGNKNKIAEMQTSVTALQQTAQKSQELSAQQEQLMSQWRAAQQGNLNQWHVAEAQYLVKLANDHMQFTHNTTLAITLLQRADQVLQDQQDPSLLDIRKSLAADLANLQALPVVDVTSLYLRIAGLDSQIDQLPLPMSALKADNAQQIPSYLPPETPWWKVGMQRSWEALRKIVIVRNTGSNAVPLVLPDEKAFLYQNLHAQMEGAIWGLLHDNTGVYQASLTRAMSWIQLYFVQDAPATKTLLQNLTDLQKVNIQPPTANLSATLQLFDNYLAAQKTNQTNPETNQTNPAAAQ